MGLDLSQLPKTETHLHIEGAIRPDTYVELRRRQEPPYSLEQSPWWKPDYRFDSLGHFLDTASPCVVNHAEDYRRIAAELFEDLLEQKVIYAEITIASHRVDIGEIAQAIHDSWRDVAPGGDLAIGILVGLFRSDSPDLALGMVRDAIDAMSLGVVGVDLLEHEAANAAGAFDAAYRLARNAGLGLRAHAGEGAGPDSVWDAIRSLGVSRIAHGVRATEDPELVAHLAREGITLDMCPTSNYRLRVIDSLDRHPLRQLFDAGVKVTVSSDDPLFFRSNVTSELALLREVLDFSAQDLLQLANNAIDSAFISQDAKDKLHRRLAEGHNKAIDSDEE
jgi:adenosine deaminase